MQLIRVPLTPYVDAHVSRTLPLPSLESLGWNRVAHGQMACLPFFASSFMGVIGRVPCSTELEPWPLPGKQCSVFVSILQGPLQGGSETRNYLRHVFFKHPLQPIMAVIGFSVLEHFISFPSCLLDNANIYLVDMGMLQAPWVEKALK